MLKDLLESKKCFKLVCGAGNEDAGEVEKLVAVYALAGAKYFDLSAKPEIVDAAMKGLQRVIPENEIKNYHLNVSVGIKGDPHVSKAFINQDECIQCGQCDNTCKIQRAVKRSGIGNVLFIDNKKCIGCGHCVEACKVGAISMISENKDLNEVLPELVEKGLSSIELHVNSKDIGEVYKQWKILQDHFKGILSICLDRSLMGDKDLITFINDMIKFREPYTTIIQADGCPMGGTDDKAETTLQALAIAQIVQKANLPVYLLLSGGTNSQTTIFAKTFNIQSHGVAIGSYGRMIVKEYINRKDFFDNESIFNQAYGVAKNLVSVSLDYLGEHEW